ncbi:MAG: NAD(P)-dependent dehydrogenase (short-subunit alcohol dehydrogenase family) [Acidimicrobiales bacterium]|jgi:NAD(P)-dependent dehydrogenase (short-subunit alcohol dehydrogenase family)
MTDLFSIEGKTAVVTGGSRGIGKMIATGYVKAGAKVFISSRKVDACTETAAELSEFGQCISIPADLSDPAEADRLAAEVMAQSDQVDILVNNAGATWGVPMDEFGEDAWEKVLSVNVKGVFHLTKALRPALLTAGSAEAPASVINIGSIDGLRVPTLETYSYSASKAAVHMLTRHLAKVFAPDIRVNAIAPGPFYSKMMAYTLDNYGDAIAKACPMKRLGQEDDMAGTAIFLASRASAYITGAILPVDGGIASLSE